VVAPVIIFRLGVQGLAFNRGRARLRRLLVPKPRNRPNKLLVGALIAIPLLAIAFLAIPRLRLLVLFFALQSTNIQNAGTWEDDPQNWNRAFHQPQPTHVQVVHSKYWKSDHFTDEFAYFFELQASPEWKDAFLKKRSVQPIPPSQARSYRENMHDDLTPSWFAPDPVANYEVWDKPGRFGSIWINKTNGNIFFYAIQL
jgi:hypothetical protein